MLCLVCYLLCVYAASPPKKAKVGVEERLMNNVSTLIEEQWRVITNIQPLPTVKAATLVPLVPTATKGVCVMHYTLIIHTTHTPLQVTLLTLN